MSGWFRWITRRFGIGRASSNHRQPPSLARNEEIMREAIQMLREAELDFRRCGQLGLSRIYRDRAARLERELFFEPARNRIGAPSSNGASQAGTKVSPTLK